MQRNICFFKGNTRNVLLLLFLTGLFFLLFPPTFSFARSVSFVWTANTDDPPVDGYRLYYKTGDPGLTLNDYNGSDTNNSNSSPVEITGQDTFSYILHDLDDYEKYSFVLTAYRGMEESAPTSAIVLEANTPPVSTLEAKISTDTLDGENPLPVTFDASSSTGDIVLYEWMFGDGSTGTGSTVNHTFIAEGNYTVTLKVTNNLAETDQATVAIVVTNPSVANNPPSAVILSTSNFGPVPFLVEFDGSTSTDSDGNIVSYEWDFGDGGCASGALTSHTYSSTGTFNAVLTVIDDGGLTDSTSIPVQVREVTGDSNTVPTAVIAASVSKGYAPLAVSFNAEQSYDADGTIESYTWSFGDGTVATGVNVTHTFLQAAVYKVTLEVKDDKGASSIPAIFTVTVMDKDQQVDSVAQALSAVYSLLLGKE